MNVGMIIVEALGSAGGAAGVGGFFLALQSRKDRERETSEELRRTVEAAKAKTAIEAAISSANAPLIARFDKNDELTQETVRRIDRLEASQFGPNGGGLREQVNKIADKQDHLISEQSDIKERLVRVETSTSVIPLRKNSRTA